MGLRGGEEGHDAGAGSIRAEHRLKAAVKVLEMKLFSLKIVPVFLKKYIYLLVPPVVDLAVLEVLLEELKKVLAAPADDNKRIE